MNGSERPHVAVGEARGLVDAVRALRAGEIGPVEVLDECLARIEASEPEVGAWVEIDADGARRAAVRQAELPREEARGLPLLGIPIGVKDIIDAAGLPTKAGSVLRADHRAQRDAPIVKILRDLGAIVLGKTETTQFATRDHARTRNPWNLARSPGGSSAGSAAAVASGMCPVALGTQTGGSITRPASFCGVASFKGAWGAWPLEDIVPVSQHLDHVGPMARSVADLALLWTLVEARLHPERAADPARRGEAIIAREWFECALPRLAVVEEYYHETSEPSALDAFKECIARLEEAGATVERLALPPSFAGMHASHGLVMAVEAAEVHRRDFRGASRHVPSGDHSAHRERAVGLGRRLPGRARAPAALRGRPCRRPRRAGGAGRRAVAGDGDERAAVRRPPHRRCAVQLGVVVQRAAHLRGAGVPPARTGLPAEPSARRRARVVRAVPGRSLVRGGAGVSGRPLKGCGPDSPRTRDPSEQIRTAVPQMRALLVPLACGAD